MRIGIGLLALTIPATALLAQGKHEHGVAELDVAVEGDEVLLLLSAPAESLVGFEHPPGDAGEQRLVDRATARLADAEDVRVVSDGENCALVESRVSDPFAERHEHADSESDHADHEAHTDFTAEWSYHCGDRVASSIEVQLFDTFEKLERVRVRSVGPNGQAVFELTPTMRVFTP